MKAVFGYVDSPEQAASLKSKFDLLTGRFLDLTVADGGFIYRDEQFATDDLPMHTDSGKLATLAGHIVLDDLGVFHNATSFPAASGVNQAFSRLSR